MSVLQTEDTSAGPDTRKDRSNAAWYSLRRTLPTWSFEQNLKELVELLPSYGVDEVVVKVDTEEFTHGQPPLEWVQQYQPRLIQIRDALQRLGIVYSLNPWITVGHTDRGRDARKQLPRLRTMVGHDGVETTCCACPLCPVWRDNTAKVWTIYSETLPHVMWVEDDIRTFNHRPVEYSCFCGEHLRRFSERVGGLVGREELVAAILQPGKPHPWRAVFFDLQADVMIDTAAFLSGVVHRTSHQTHLGLMSSGPRQHSLEGRRWNEFAIALAGGRTLYSRPPMDNYSESSLRGFYYSHDSIKLTRYCLPAGVIEQTEVENVPFTQYSKSIAATFIETAISFAYGSHGVTLNLFDHAGTPMANTPAYGQMLGQRKPFLNALALIAQQPGQYRGVQLLFHERESREKHVLPNARYDDLAADGFAAMSMLESHGLPTTFTDSSIACAVGQQLRAVSDDNIRQVLSSDRGLLIDGPAAAILAERGFASLIGVKDIQPTRSIDEIGPVPFAAEEVFHPEFGGADRKYLTLTLPGLDKRPSMNRLTVADSALVASRVVDPDATRHHVCSYGFENKLGGRVFVLAYDLASAYGVAFNHPHRADQLHAAVRWLSRDRSSIQVRGDGVYPLAFRKDIADATLLGFFNLSLDPWTLIHFSISDSRRIGRISTLTPDGSWMDNHGIAIDRDGELGIRLAYRGSTTYDTPLFIRIAWE
jgi:hypothetical protein